MEPEIKRLYRVQTINSILNLEAPGGEWRKKKKTKMKSDEVLHMLIIYLGGSTGLARKKACVLME